MGVIINKGDVKHLELLSASLIPMLVASVFAQMQQIVKCNGAHVAGCLKLGVRGGGTLLNKIFYQAKGNSKFALGWWVLVMIPLYLTFKGQPVAAFSAIQWVWASIHFKSLANGTDDNLNSASPCSLSPAVGAGTYHLGEGCDEFNALDVRDIGALGPCYGMV